MELEEGPGIFPGEHNNNAVYHAYSRARCAHIIRAHTKSPRLRSSGVWWLCVSHRRCRCKSVVSSLPVNSRIPGVVYTHDEWRKLMITSLL